MVVVGVEAAVVGGDPSLCEVEGGSLLLSTSFSSVPLAFSPAFLIPPLLPTWVESARGGREAPDRVRFSFPPLSIRCTPLPPLALPLATPAILPLLRLPTTSLPSMLITSTSLSSLTFLPSLPSSPSPPFLPSPSFSSFPFSPPSFEVVGKGGGAAGDGVENMGESPNLSLSATRPPSLSPSLPFSLSAGGLSVGLSERRVLLLPPSLFLLSLPSPLCSSSSFALSPPFLPT
mmetsp:Transcript_5639/g.13151  ORF Transcript_5639/g.13151 Transcript_5639/m.13151 type:complete len:232 (-) Transcript_5639:464-1159(-)